MTKAHWLALLAFVLAVVAGATAYWSSHDPWISGTVVLLVAILITTLPIGQAFLNQVAIDAAPKWIEDANNLGPQKQRVQDHYARMKGTLVFWKNKAAAHDRLDSARVVWSLLSAVLLPVLVQIYDARRFWAVVFMTLLTTWTGFVVALAYTLKSEQLYQGMRQQESDFYDLARHLLDFADPNDPNLQATVDQYIADAENIRQTARRVETGSPPSALDLRR